MCYGLLGLKLDGGGGTDGSSILPYGSDGNGKAPTARFRLPVPHLENPRLRYRA
jgi:hypothetical protein